MMVLVPLLRWWLLLELVGLVGLPISMVLLRALPGRGVCFRGGRALALCLHLLVTRDAGTAQNTTASAAPEDIVNVRWCWFGARTVMIGVCVAADPLIRQYVTIALLFGLSVQSRIPY